MAERAPVLPVQPRRAPSGRGRLRASRALALHLRLDGLRRSRRRARAPRPRCAARRRAVARRARRCEFGRGRARSAARSNGQTVLYVEGSLRQRRRPPLKAPALRVALIGDDGRPLYTWKAKAAKAEMEASGRTPFQTRLLVAAGGVPAASRSRRRRRDSGSRRPASATASQPRPPARSNQGASRTRREPHARSRFQSFADHGGPAGTSAAHRRAARGAGGAESRRLRHPARRPPPERISAGRRGAAAVGDRLLRLGRPRHRAARTRRRCSSTAATPCRRRSRPTRDFRAPPGRRESARRLAARKPEARRRARLRPLAAHVRFRRRRFRAACEALGARFVARRRQPHRRALDRPPRPAARPARRAPAAPRRRNGAGQARTACAASFDADALLSSAIPTTSPGCSTSAAPTSPIRRCRSPSRWSRAKARRGSIVDPAKLTPPVARAARRRSRPCTIPPNWSRRSLAEAKAGRKLAVRQGDRALPADRRVPRRRRQVPARRPTR